MPKFEVTYAKTVTEVVIARDEENAKQRIIEGCNDPLKIEFISVKKLPRDPLEK